ncbi:MAG: PEP-CTERM sorting domain-containing protein, partial [Thermoguttaceae bacterium]|nr:PEP-CTERM sorting domain-containing protein [Thermoguttaceae bacterium]
VTDLTDDSLSKVVIDHGAYNSAAFGTFDFLEGHHYAIDLRVYNGGGGAGPYNISGSGIPSGIGIGASLEGFTDGVGNDSFVTPYFDETGALLGSPLRGANQTNVFPQDIVLNQGASFDASQANVQFDGQISGPGALTLKNGSYTLTHEGNSVGDFTLENATYDASKTNGVMQVAGDLTLTDSAISLSLNGLESDEGWSLFSVADGGTVTMNGTSWTFNYDGVPEMGVNSIKLIDVENLPENFWESATLAITNPNVLGYVALDANGAYLVFGDSTALPEPAAWLLLLFGAAGLGIVRSRKMKMKK